MNPQKVLTLSLTVHECKPLASGTLKSQQTPTNKDVPKMLLNLTQQIANLRRYMEEAGLIQVGFLGLGFIKP